MPLSSPQSTRKKIPRAHASNTTIRVQPIEISSSDKIMRQAEADFDYTGDDGDQLTFRAGDMITILKEDPSGWWYGRMENGYEGIFPYNYVTELRVHSPQSQETESILARTTSVPVSHEPGGNEVSVQSISPKQIGVKAKTHDTRFGVWAANIAVGGAFMGIFLGPVGLQWTKQEQFMGQDTGAMEVGAVYTLLASIVVFGYEWKVGSNTKITPYPFKAGIYLLLSILPFLNEVTVVVGASWLMAAAANLYSWYLKEECVRPLHNPRESELSKLNDGLVGFFTKKKEEGELGQVVFLACYIMLNVILFITGWAQWSKANDELRDTLEHMSAWAPLAKAFGYTLDLNCAVLLLPVCRTFIRALYNKSTGDQSVSARRLRKVLYWIPVDSSIEFHMLVAKAIAIGATGHTVTHFVNLSLSRENTINTFSVHPYWNGGLILMVMVLLYAASDSFVKKSHFELFMYAHHGFILFYLLLILHGRAFFNPNFLAALAIPGSLYIAERIYRYFISQRPVTVLSATYMRPSILMLEFEKSGIFSSGYKEGQYIFIKCPHVAPAEWHPFTISSAPESGSITLHIRIMGPGSWTRAVQEYLTMFGRIQGNYQPFFHTASNGAQVPGMVNGPDGKPIFQVYGPHSAPTQHATEYTHVMIMGAGIGVTPVASTLKSIVHNKWKNHVGQVFPEKAYFYWVVAHRDIASFRWFLREIKEAFDAVHDMYAKNPDSMTSKDFEFHIFVTSVPKDTKRFLEEEVPSLDDASYWGPSLTRRADGVKEIERSGAPFSEADLLRELLNPKETQEEYLDEQLFIYKGRPDWKAQFGRMVEVYSSNVKVGVTYCGNPIIGNDLGHACSIYSSAADKRFFVLHKEKF